jgi:gluconolactonase
MPSDPVRYPDPRIKILDPRFAPLVLGNAAVETIATGCRFTEGPVWFGDLWCLPWSDIPNDRMMEWEEETGAVSLFANRRITPTAIPATVRGV